MAILVTIFAPLGIKLTFCVIYVYTAELHNSQLMLFLYICFQDLAILVTIFAALGKACIKLTFCVIYVYTAELFPTPVRHLAVGSSSMMSRFGGLLAPFMGEPMVGFVWLEETSFVTLYRLENLPKSYENQLRSLDRLLCMVSETTTFTLYIMHHTKPVTASADLEKNQPGGANSIN